MTEKLNKVSSIVLALCGGIMFGVSIPIMAASIGKILPLLLGFFMAVSGFLLVCVIKTNQLIAKKILLALHILIAISVLIATSIINQHLFLIVWAILVVILAVVGLNLLRNEKST